MAARLRAHRWRHRAAAVLVLCASASWAGLHEPARVGQPGGAGGRAWLAAAKRTPGVWLVPHRTLALRGGGADEGAMGEQGGFGQVRRC